MIPICLLVFSILLPSISIAEQLTIPGTGDSQELLRILGPVFEERNPGVVVQIPDSIGSSGGIRALKSEKASLCRTARPLKAEERSGLVEFNFAISPIVFVVHPSVETVTDLSDNQILKIYSGEYRNWLTVGGSDHKIYPVDREAGDSSRTVLEKKLTGFSRVVSKAKVFYTTPDAVKAISRHRYTLGFLPKAAVIGTNLKILSVNGHRPEEKIVSKGRYPYVVSFYVVSKGQPQGLEKRFIMFLNSPEARAIMRQNGIIPLKIEGLN